MAFKVKDCVTPGVYADLEEIASSGVPFEKLKNSTVLITGAGGFIGFHVSAFTTESDSWSWYFEEFLGSGNFRTNTWNPTPELLKVESSTHPAVANVPSIASRGIPTERDVILYASV